MKTLEQLAEQAGMSKIFDVWASDDPNVYEGVAPGELAAFANLVRAQAIAEASAAIGRGENVELLAAQCPFVPVPRYGLFGAG